MSGGGRRISAKQAEWAAVGGQAGRWAMRGNIGKLPALTSLLLNIFLFIIYDAFEY